MLYKSLCVKNNEFPKVLEVCIEKATSISEHVYLIGNVNFKMICDNYVIIM